MLQPKFNIYVNKKSVPINDRGLNYGDGIFETILVINKKAIFIDDQKQNVLAAESIGIKVHQYTNLEKFITFISTYLKEE